MTPTVSAIVLNYRHPQDTVRCVQAVLSQTIAEELEVIVVENHSLNDSIGVVRNRLTDERVRIVESPRNCGFGQGNNIGVRHARGEFLLIINPDTALEPDALQKMVTFLKQNKDVGIVGPQLQFSDHNIRDSYRTFPRVTDLFIKRTVLKKFFPERMRSYLQWDADPEETRDVDWVVGACFLITRDLYQELGGFDPRFFIFFEDTDLCRRCWNAGKRVVYFPQAKAHDSANRLSSGGILSFFTKWTVREHLLSAIKYFWKWRREA